MNKKALDFFVGQGSFASKAAEMGWKVWGTDIVDYGWTDWTGDIRALPFQEIPKRPDIAWFSPPCQAFSVASIGKHWHKEHRAPKTDKARDALELVQAVKDIIAYIEPKKYYIENPRGMLRKLPIMDFAPIRHTITYCQYGDTRMKPTDIWTNDWHWIPRPMCKNGDPCHIAAPRGSRTGTQGIKGSINRAAVPEELVEEILNVRQFG